MSRKPLSSAQRPPEPPQALYTPEQAARLKVGRTSLYGLMRRGELDEGQLGRLRRITPQALQAYLDRHHQGQLP